MVDEMKEVYNEERKGMHNSNDFLKLFKHIKDNQLFYKNYFKLDVGETFPNHMILERFP